MKKLIALFLLLFIVGTTISEAQRRQRGPRLTKEERVDRTTTRLYVALELNDSQMKAVKTALKTHADDVEKLVLDSEERPSREDIKKLGETRDESIKGILNETQSQKYDRMQERLQQRTRQARERRAFAQRFRRGGRSFRGQGRRFQRGDRSFDRFGRRGHHGDRDGEYKKGDNDNDESGSDN